MLIFLITFFSLVSFNIVLSREDWIDPHDMNSKKSSTPHSTEQSDNCECPVPMIPNFECDCPTQSTINFAIAHHKRVINLLLGAVVIDRSDMVNYKGRLYINIPQEDYDMLKTFTMSSAEDPATLRTVDQILSRILVKPSYEQLTETLISWTDYIYFTFYNRTTAVLAACIFLLFISYKLVKANLTIWTVTKYLIFLGWVTDFAFTWIRLLQESEINKMADSLKYSSIPSHCDPNKMTMLQYIGSFFRRGDPCREYHQIVLQETIWSIGPVMVLSHQFGTLVLTPASYVGKAVGTFTDGILTSLPWGVNIMLLPVLLVFSAIVLCISLSFVTQTSFSFNMFHVFKLEFAKNERQAIGDVLSGHNLSALMNVMQRNMIEEVRQADTVENTVTCEVSNFRETIEHQTSNEVSNNEPKGDCDNTKTEGVDIPKSSVSSTLDGSGDRAEYVDN